MVMTGRCVRTFCYVLFKIKHVNAHLMHNGFKSYNAVCAVRLFGSYRLRCDETEEIKHPRNTQQILLNCLQGIYNCTEDQCKIMVKQSRDLKYIHSKVLQNNAKLMKENGLDLEKLVANSWVLLYKPQLLPSALQYLRTIHKNINVSLPFLALPYPKLAQLSCGAVVEKGENRIDWLSDMLNYDVHEVSKYVAKSTFMLTLPRSRILSILDVLEEAGISSEDTVRDFSVFCYHIERLRKRCAEVKDAGIHIKPWCLRCSEDTYRRMMEKRVKNKLLLGDFRSTREYIAACLECEEDDVSYIIKKIPQLRYITVAKVKLILDYLYEVGYTAVEVRQTSRILTRSVTTVKSRFTEMQALGLNRPSLLFLCKTSKEYKRVVEKLKADNGLYANFPDQGTENVPEK